MNLDHAQITLPCPHCSADVSALFAHLRRWPVLTCAACDRSFAVDVGTLLDLAGPGSNENDQSNMRFLRLLKDEEIGYLPAPTMRLNEGH